MDFWRELFLTFSAVALAASALALLAPGLLRLPRAQGQLLVGLVCGAGAIGTMLSSFPVSPGIQIDLRASLIAIAALSGGAIGAAISALMAMAFRVYQGGAGAGIGAALVAFTAAATLGIRLAMMKTRIRRRAIFSTALVAALLSSIAILTVPGLSEQQRWAVGLPLFWLTMTTIVIVGLTLRQATDAAWETHMLRAALAQAPNFFYVKNRRSQFVAANRRVAEHHGFDTPEQLQGQTDFDLADPERSNRLMAAEQTLMRTGTGIREQVEKITQPDGRDAWYETSKVALRDPWGGVIGLTGVTVDITERMRLEADLRAANAALEALAGTDPLTGLANRRTFDAMLARTAMTAERSGLDMAVLMVDVDWFKSYNDIYGHLQGDDCLRTIGSILQAALQRPSDLAARYGGEEFAAVLPETDLAGALVVAERIRSEILRRAIPHRGSSHGCVTASIGVTAAKGGGAPEALLATADSALYAAKLADRNAIRTAVTAGSHQPESGTAAAIGQER